MKTTLRKTAYLLIVSTFCFTACNNGSGNDNGNDTTSLGEKMGAAADSMKAGVNNMMDQDANFVQDVVKANAEEIKWLQAGMDDGTNRKLKSDAKSMMADHKDLETKMKDYASRKNISLPAEDNSSASLSETKGKNWDKAWADKMVDAHQQTIDKFESGQNNVKDEELKSMIISTLPTLHHHLDMMKTLQDKMK